MKWMWCEAKNETRNSAVPWDSMETQKDTTFEVYTLIRGNHLSTKQVVLEVRKLALKEFDRLIAP